MAHYALAVDIGGTFTDAVLRSADGRTWVDKTLTTPKASTRVSSGGDRCRAQDRRDRARRRDRRGRCTRTTLVTNAVIERKGAATALLMTEGFRDILEIRDEHRYDIYDPRSSNSRSRWSREADARGSTSACSPTAGPDAARSWRRRRRRSVSSGARDRGRCRLSASHAYRNPAHERRLGQTLAERRRTSSCRSRRTWRRRSANIERAVDDRDERLYVADRRAIPRSRCAAD